MLSAAIILNKDKWLKYSQRIFSQAGMRYSYLFTYQSLHLLMYVSFVCALTQGMRWEA